MSEQEGCQFDIRMHTECTQCHTSKPLRYALTLTTVGEHSTLLLRIDPDEFSPCPQCGNALRLRIKSQPFDPANHLDSPVMRSQYEKDKPQ
jgi:hypothetical protein